MADENQSRNGDAVSTRTPRRSAAGNKAWQTLMPHHKHAAATASAASSQLDEMDEEEEEQQAAPALTQSASGRGAALRAKATPAAAAAAAAPATTRKTVAAAPATVSTPARDGAAATAAAPPPLSQPPPRGLSDDEELEEASAELFPKPPPDVKKPSKRKGRPPKNGGSGSGADGGSRGSSMASTPSMTKKVKLEDDFEMEDEMEDEEEDGEFGGPPMLNRMISHTTPTSSSLISSYARRACSPTCTKRCCLTEDGKRVSRQTTTGVRSDQYDPPYNARPSGKRKPRTPKAAGSDAGDYGSEKKSRAPYGSKKGDKEMMKSVVMHGGMGGGGGGAAFGSSAPGARSMLAVSAGRSVSTMPQRPPAPMGGAGGGAMPRVVGIGQGGKVQPLSRAVVGSPGMTPMVVAGRPRVTGGADARAASAAGGGGGVTRYPVAVASQQQQQQQQRMPGPAELVRAENSVNDQYRQARAAFAQHVVAGSSATEFNRVIDLLTVENKRLVQAQTDDQEYVDNLHHKIRTLENHVASLQRQLAVTTKAYHGAVCSSQLLEVNADRNAHGPVPTAGAPRMMVARPAGTTAPLAHKTEKADEADTKPEKEEGEGQQGGEEGVRAQVVPGASTAKTAAAPGAPGASKVVPRLMDQQARGAAVAAQMINRQQWMNEFDDEDEMYEELMEEIEGEELAYFDDDIEDEEEHDNMGLD